MVWSDVTTNLVELFAKTGARRVCITGTCFEYQWPSDADCDELKTALGSHTLYDIAKNTCRTSLEAIAARHELKPAWARVFYLYGPHEFPGRLVSSVCRSLVRNQPALCSSGVAVRDFMDSRDAGSALAALVLSEVEGPINVASGNALEIRKVAGLLGEIYGKPELIRIGAIPDRPGDPPRISASVTRLRNEVGFSPSISIADGLRNALEFWASEKPDGNHSR